MIPEDEDYAYDGGVQYFTHDEALAIAQAEASRPFDDSGNPLRYVTFDEEAHDHVLVEFVQEEGGWTKMSRSLLPAERLESEQISDETIRSVAIEGNLVSAIRLYRVKYDAGLRDAMKAVEALVGGAKPPAAS